MLETRGIPTVAIALVLPQVEKTRPPRALMTPFMLGRPYGEPGDPAFQRRVIEQALRLLERADGPVILDHFADDPPGAADRPGWRAALPTAALEGDPGSASAWHDAFARELQLVVPAWERFRARFGRTTVGLSGVEPAAWPRLFADFIGGELPVVAPNESAALTLRFVADDLKALYGEAVQGEGPAPSARQIDAWFWRQTVAGRLLRAVRAVAIGSANNGVKTVGTRFLVPAPWLVP